MTLLSRWKISYLAVVTELEDIPSIGTKNYESRVQTTTLRTVVSLTELVRVFWEHW